MSKKDHQHRKDHKDLKNHKEKKIENLSKIQDVTFVERNDKRATPKHSVVELRGIAKELGLTGYTKYKKEDLIHFINSHLDLPKGKILKDVEEPQLPLKKLPSPPPKKKDPATTAAPTIRDLIPQDHNIPKKKINKEYTPEFLKMNKSGPSSFVRIRQLGKPGKEGTVYLVMDPETQMKYAMKTFRKKKSGKTLEKEAFFQHLASLKGISPKIYEYNQEEKYIVMDMLEKTLIDVINDQKGELTEDQQKQIINLYNLLDEIGVMINDANPLNLMTKGNRIYAIDYGFAKFTDHKDFKGYARPNYQLMPLGFLLWLKDKVPISKWIFLKHQIDPALGKKLGVENWK